MSTTTEAPQATWQQKILADIEDIAAEQILEDSAILELPYLVLGFQADETVTLLARVATSDAADEEAVLQARKGVYERIQFETLASIGFPAAVALEQVDDDPDPGDTTDRDAAAAAIGEGILTDSGGVITPEQVAALEASPDADGKQLFDASDYDREDLAIARIDGNQIDRIALAFTGTVYLDRSDPSDVALYNKLRLGHDVTLMVEGKCSGTGAKGATDREGDLDVTIGQKGVKVTTVYVPPIADELDQAEAA